MCMHARVVCIYNIHICVCNTKYKFKILLSFSYISPISGSRSTSPGGKKFVSTVPLMPQLSSCHANSSLP